MAALRDHRNVVSNVDQDFILKAARADIRSDGRSTMQRRKIDLQFGRVNGKSRLEVCLGNTRVMATVSAELIAPFADRPNEGFLEVNSFVSPMASPLYDSGRTSDLGAHVTSVIDKGLKDTRAVDLEALCVVAGNKVWSVRCDVTVLDHDGNIVDAAMLAAIGALLHFRKPDVTVIGETVTVHDFDERKPVPIAIHFIPLCVSFGLLGHGLVLLDPTAQEEAVSLGTTTVMLNSHREVCGVQKHGRPGISPAQLISCISNATQIYTSTIEQMNKAVAEAELASSESDLRRALAHSQQAAAENAAEGEKMET